MKNKLFLLPTLPKISNSDDTEQTYIQSCEESPATPILTHLPAPWMKY